METFVAMMISFTKWHRTGAGGYFVKSGFRSVFREVARDNVKSRLRVIYKNSGHVAIWHEVVRD